MSVWGQFRKVFGLPSDYTRDRSEPRSDNSPTKATEPKDHEGGSIDRDGDSLKQIYKPVEWQVQVLPAVKEDGRI